MARQAPRTGEVFRQRVRDARKAHGWSQERLATEAGMYSTVVTKIETGQRKDVTLDELVSLSAALKVSPAWLLTPADPHASVGVTADLIADAWSVRGWFAGEPLGPGFDDPRAQMVMPDEERAAHRWPALVALRRTVGRLVTDAHRGDSERMLRRLDAVTRYVEQLRDELADEQED